MEKGFDKTLDLSAIATEGIIKYRVEMLEKAKAELAPSKYLMAEALVNDYCNAVLKVIDLLIPLYDSPYGGPIIIALASLSDGCGHLQKFNAMVPRMLVEITSPSIANPEEEIVLSLLKTIKKLMPNAKEGKEAPADLKPETVNGKGADIIEEMERVAG